MSIYLFILCLLEHLMRIYKPTPKKVFALQLLLSSSFQRNFLYKLAMSYTMPVHWPIFFFNWSSVVGGFNPHEQNFQVRVNIENDWNQKHHSLARNPEFWNLLKFDKNNNTISGDWNILLTYKLHVQGAPQPVCKWSCNPRYPFIFGHL